MKSKQLDERQSNQSFWAILAFTRFVLAFIILADHTYYFTNPFLMLVKAFSGMAALGGLFMISGYSIANSVEQESKHFYLRRLWRIYPTYAFTLCVTFLPYIIYGQNISYHFCKQPTLIQVIGSLFLLQGILVTRPDSNPSIWTLSYAEICYLLTPFFQRAKPWVITGLITISAALYATNLRIDYVNWKYSQQLWGFSTAALIWIWLLGFAFFRWKGNWRYPPIFLSAILFYFNNQSGGCFAPITIGAVAIVLIKGVEFNISSALLRKVFLYLGELSYPLFLLHMPLMHWTFQLFDRPTSVWLEYLIIFLISDLTLRLITRPFRRLNIKSHTNDVANECRV